MSNKSPLWIQQRVMLNQDQQIAIPMLDNLAREPYWISEIHLAAEADVTEYQAHLPEIGMGSDATLLEFGLRLQDTYISHPDLMPFWLLRSPNFDWHLVGAAGLLAPIGARWVLPERIYVPAGAKLYSVVRYNAAEGCNAWATRYDVRVTLIGQRALEDAPPVMTRVPFATGYRTPKTGMSNGGVLQTFRSGEHELGNFTNTDVVVQRVSAMSIGNWAQDVDNNYPQLGIFPACHIPTNVRFWDSRGQLLIRGGNGSIAGAGGVGSYPLLQEIFSNGAWDMGTVLHPKEFLVVEGTIDSQFACGDPQDIWYSQALPPTYQQRFQQAMFGLIGYREVPTQLIWGPALVASRAAVAAQPVGVPAANAAFRR